MVNQFPADPPDLDGNEDTGPKKRAMSGHPQDTSQLEDSRYRLSDVSSVAHAK